MNFTQYQEQVLNDAMEAIDENFEYWFDNGPDFDHVYDDLFVDDSVTGNGSGSYTFNTSKAKENIWDMMFDDDNLELFREIGYEDWCDVMKLGPEGIDVAIRVIALGYVYNKIEEYWNAKVAEKKSESDFVKGEDYMCPLCGQIMKRTEDMTEVWCDDCGLAVFVNEDDEKTLRERFIGIAERLVG